MKSIKGTLYQDTSGGMKFSLILGAGISFIAGFPCTITRLVICGSTCGSGELPEFFGLLGYLVVAAAIVGVLSVTIGFILGEIGRKLDKNESSTYFVVGTYLGTLIVAIPAGIIIFGAGALANIADCLCF